MPVKETAGGSRGSQDVPNCSSVLHSSILHRIEMKTACTAHDCRVAQRLSRHFTWSSFAPARRPYKFRGRPSRMAILAVAMQLLFTHPSVVRAMK